MSETEIKPCRFCGSPKVASVPSSSTAHQWAVICLACDARGPKVLRMEGESDCDVSGRAIERWNRSISPHASEIVTGLSAFSDHLESGGTPADWPGTHKRPGDAGG